MRLIPFHIWLILLLSTTMFFLLHSVSPVYIAISCLIFMAFFLWGIFDFTIGFFGKVIYKPIDGKQTIALTFDDGPDPAITPMVLDLLDKYSIKATFFIIAKKAKMHPDIVKRIFLDEHIIACHDLNHKLTANFRTTKPLEKDISEALRIIENIIGKKPVFYRPPVGILNPHLLGVCKKLGIMCVCWNRRPLDGGNRNIKGIRRIAQMAHKGSIILLHDTLPIPMYKSEYLHAIESLFRSIIDTGINTETIDQQLNLSAYQ